MNGGVDIRSVGMVTAVGLDAPSACAAMRAKLDGFQETSFLATRGRRLIGAPVPMLHDLKGESRMAHLAAAAIWETFENVPEAREDAPVMLCLPEDTRPGRPIDNSEGLLRRICRSCGLEPHRLSRVIAQGRPSGHLALENARTLLASGDARYVVIAGVDSYLTSRSIRHFLSSKRLVTADNPDGFIPGEAASAVLCAPAGEGVLHLRGLGIARESAYPYNEDDLPLRGDGMTSAYAAALEQASLTLAQIEYRVSDLIGERYFYKQTGLAAIRLERGRTQFQDLLSPGETVGNVGAAVVPLMIGMVFTAVTKGYRTASPLLVEASADDGTCGAAVFEARTS